MVKLADIQKQAASLSREDRAGLITHLLYSLEEAPEGIADEEVIERDRAMEAGDTIPISHEQFLREARGDKR